MASHAFLGSASNGIFCIRGINLFKCKWETVGDCETVFDPKTKAPYSFSVYKITVGSQTVEFIAGEKSDGVWLFYEA